MKRNVRYLSALVAATLAFSVGTSTAHALDGGQIACFDAIGRAGLRYTLGLLKLNQKCRNANLRTALSCPGPRPAAITGLETKLEAGLARKCTFLVTDANLAVMGFPGSCVDATPLTAFDGADLNTCIKDTHTAAVNSLLAIEYDATLTTLAGDDLSCQKEIAKTGRNLLASVTKAVQRCRSRINKGKLIGVLPALCQTADPKTAAAVTKAVTRAQAKLQGKCNTDLMVTTLKVCEPNQSTVGTAATCISDAHRLAGDNPSLLHAATLIDIEYAKPAACGDSLINRPNEECDGDTQDAACDGLCGSPTGLFPCMCQNIPRTRVVEHANADLDIGWTGLSHDSGIIEGGGYVTELHDCDNLVDFDCNLGPSCSLPPHSPCSATLGPPFTTGNSICAGLGQGTCRRTRAGTTGPHCEIDFDQECESDAQCPGFQDRCIFVPHGMPLPLSANGLSVCVQNHFTQDVVGTKNLLTGASSVVLRQQSITRLGDVSQPCPLCGGFCSAPLPVSGPGGRSRCDDDADCPGSFCVTAPVCSFGVNADKACRTTVPFGGASPVFGTTSQDCPLAGADIGKLDIFFDPARTTTVTQQASVTCNAAGFGGNVCFQGAYDGRACTVPGDCPGGVCIPQCFCPNDAAGTAQKPNACNAACKGGAFDAQPCNFDSECDPPNGFCHAADCRHNVLDTASAQEGNCTAGPVVGTCSLTTFKACDVDADCGPPVCPFCQPAETCVIQNQNCFVNSERFRVGTPGVPDLVSAAHFCIPRSSAPSVNATSGLPGPGAITQPATTTEVGF